MTASYTILISTRNHPADACILAREVLLGMGASWKQIYDAKHFYSATGCDWMGIPPGVDCYIPLPDQGLPSWVRAVNLAPEYLTTAMSDYEGDPGIQADIESGIYDYLVRIVADSDHRSARTVSEGIARVQERWHVVQYGPSL